MELVDRLKEFVNYLGMPITKFADNCGISRPTMSQVKNGRSAKISDDFIRSIHAAYPQLSVMWLMFGEGDMLVASDMRFSEPQNGQMQSDFESQASNYEPVEGTQTRNFSYPAGAPENTGASQEAEPTLFGDNEQPLQPHFSPSEGANPSAMLDGYPAASPGSFGPSRHPISPTSSVPTNSTEVNVSSIPSMGGGAIPPNPAPFSNPQVSSAPAPSTATGRTINFEVHDFPLRQASSETGSSIKGADSPSSQGNRVTTPSSGICNGNVHGADARVSNAANTIAVATEPGKTITNIVVFYSDQSFQTFQPA